MIQLNLLPDLKKEFIRSQKTKGLVISGSVIITLGAFGLSALLFIYVTFIQQVQINLATDDINRKTLELKNIPDIDKYLTVQNQLASLPGLHENKGSYARLFTFLNVLNPSAPNDVQLNNLQLVTPDHNIVFTGTTASFRTLNVFADTLKNAEVTYSLQGQADFTTTKMFDKVSVQSSGLAKVNGKNVVAFTISTIHNPAVFDVRNGRMTAKVPNITTTPSVTQNPQAKQNLFDKAGE